LREELDGAHQSAVSAMQSALSELQEQLVQRDQALSDLRASHASALACESSSDVLSGSSYSPDPALRLQIEALEKRVAGLKDKNKTLVQAVCHFCVFSIFVCFFLIIFLFCIFQLRDADIQLQSFESNLSECRRESDALRLESEHCRAAQVKAAHELQVALKTVIDIRSDSDHRISELDRNWSDRYERILAELKSMRRKASSASSSQPDVVEKLVPISDVSSTPSCQSNDASGSTVSHPHSMTPLASPAPSVQRDESRGDDSLVEELTRLQSKRDAEAQRAKVIIQSLRQRLVDAEKMIAVYRERQIASSEELVESSRSRSRAQANMDYLKNLIVKFMLMHNAEERFTLIPVIGAVLRFSPSEKIAINSSFAANSSIWLPAFASSVIGPRVPFPISSLNDDEMPVLTDSGLPNP
jgi:hypothetical protein